MEPLPRSWLVFARSCMAMVPLPRSWQDLGKASKELAMDLGKGTMASNTGQPITNENSIRFCYKLFVHYYRAAILPITVMIYFPRAWYFPGTRKL